MIIENVEKKDLVDTVKESLKFLKNNDLILIKGIFTNVPSWDNFIKHIDFVNKKEYIPSNIRENPVGVYSDELYIRVADAIDNDNSNYLKAIFPQLNEILVFCENIFEEKTMYAETYMNLKTDVSVKKPHNDPWIAVGWTCIGNIDWRTYDSFDENSEFKSNFAKPGDLVIIPKGTIHSVVPLEPRASISIAYNIDKH